MNDETDRSLSWRETVLEETGGHSIAAKPVEEDFPVNGLPAKDALAEATFYGLNGVYSRELPETVSPTRIAEALEALIFLRVKQIRHEYVKCPNALHYRQIRYPAFMWDIVRAIGDIIDRDDAVTLSVTLGEEL